jgi:hypothetical protein
MTRTIVRWAVWLVFLLPTLVIGLGVAIMAGVAVMATAVAAYTGILWDDKRPR